jgi:Cu-Zn family superoxide dismutase
VNDAGSANGGEPADPSYAPGEIAQPTTDEVTGVEDAAPITGARTTTASMAKAELEAASESGASGTLAFAQSDGILHITGEIVGLAPGVHGLHVHEIGDCSAPDASSAGGHYAPRGSRHGAPTQTEDMHHAGDLGNIVADADGKASVDVIDDGLTLAGPETIVGRAIVVHADPDDLVSQPAGNSGDRVACGVIEDGAAATAG